jgi:hypothetical protein
MSALRDTDLMGSARRCWLEEARDLWAGRHESEPDDEKYLWIARCIVALSVLQRRDDEVANLPVVCKGLLYRCPDPAEPLGELGGHAAAILRAAGIVVAKAERGTTP